MEDIFLENIVVEKYHVPLVENISRNFACIFTPYTFPEKAKPFFHFILVVGGVIFSDWRCDILVRRCRILV